MRSFTIFFFISLFSQMSVAADYQSILFGTNEDGGRCAFTIEQNIKYDVVLDKDGKFLSRTAVGTYIVRLSYSDDLNKYHDPEAYDPNVISQVGWSYNHVKKSELSQELLNSGVRLSKSKKKDLLFSVQLEGVTDMGAIKEQATTLIIDVPFRKDLEKTSYICVLD